MEKRVLVSAAGGDIGLAVMKSLSAAGMSVVSCDMNECPIVGHQFFRVPSASDSAAYIKAINSIVAENRIGCFIPVSEPEVQAVSMNRSALPSVMLGVNNAKTVEVFSDKYKTAEFLKALDIPVPKTFGLNEYKDQLSFPFIVKARSGCGSKSLWIARDIDDVDYLKNKDDGNLIAQELIGDASEEYTTGIFSDGVRVDSITFRRRLGFGGVTIDAELIDCQVLKKMAEIIARATHLIGSINLQTRKRGDRYFPFEINPRLSSTLLIRKKFGFDDAVWWVKTLAGEGYSYKQKYSKGRVIRSLKESYFDMEPST